MRASGYYTAIRLLGGAFSSASVCDGTGKCISTYAFGVRCVLDLISREYGLQLCERYESSSYGAARCWEYYGSCQGAANSISANANNCYPNDLWSSTPAGSEYRALDLVGGIFRPYGPCGTGYCPSSLAFSARCVLVLISADHRFTAL